MGKILSDGSIRSISWRNHLLCSLALGLLAGASKPAGADGHLSVLLDFPLERTMTTLTLAPDGSFYGAGATPSEEGAYGAIYRLTPPPAGDRVWRQTLLYAFKGGKDGASPFRVVVDPAGNLYGLSGGDIPTKINGTLFELSPPTGGQKDWTFTLLHSFKFEHPDEGTSPIGTVARDKAGNFYGAASGGGKYNAGLVFELSPPAAGATDWTETILHDFTGKHDGNFPLGGVILDKAGNLYGTTYYGGSGNRAGLVYRLTPPSAAGKTWTETVLHTCTDGTGCSSDTDLAMDAKGNLFGSGMYGPYEISPPPVGDKVWRGTALPVNNPSPFYPVEVDGAGDVYAIGIGSSDPFPVTYPCVVKLFPPGTDGHKIWTSKVVHEFTGGHEGAAPEGQMVVDSAGNLYGMTYGGGKYGNGTFYEVTP